MRTAKSPARGLALATATASAPSLVSTAWMRLESHSGGGRMMPSTPVASSSRTTSSSCCFGVALLDHQLHVTQASLLQAADQKFAQVGGTRIAVQQADAHLFGTRQGPRGEVGRVFELGDRRLHGFARFLADVVLAVDHARHRHRSKARVGGHIGDRRCALACGAWVCRLRAGSRSFAG